MKKLLILLTFIFAFGIVQSQIGRYPYSKGIVSAGGSAVDSASWEVEYKAVYYEITEAVRPGIDTADVFNTWVKAIKTADAWSDLDGWFWFAARESTATLINWIDPTGDNGTYVGSPTFTQWEGFTAASGKYFNTTLDPSVGGYNFIQDDASIGAYLRTASISGEDHPIGSEDGNIYIRPDGGSGTIVARVNSSSAAYWTTQGSQGFIIGCRADNANVAMFFNGSDLGDQSANSAALSEGRIYFGNDLAYGSTNQIAAGFFGANLTNAKITVINNATEVVMDYLGKGVQ